MRIKFRKLPNFQEELTSAFTKFAEVNHLELNIPKQAVIGWWDIKLLSNGNPTQEDTKEWKFKFYQESDGRVKVQQVINDTAKKLGTFQSVDKFLFVYRLIQCAQQKNKQPPTVTFDPNLPPHLGKFSLRLPGDETAKTYTYDTEGKVYTENHQQISLEQLLEQQTTSPPSDSNTHEDI